MIEPAHILVVDDDPSIRRLLQMALMHNGYRVSTAENGVEALTYVDLVSPDLILLDWMMPGMNGLEVTRRLKQIPDALYIPIILITAQGDQHSKVSALDEGADDFLVKPVDMAELLARVRAMLRLQRSQRSLRDEQRKTALLLHLSRALGTTLDLEQLLTQFLDKLADATGALRASMITLHDTQPRLYVNTRERALPITSDILCNGAAGWVIRERQALVIADTLHDARWIEPPRDGPMVRSVAAVPIVRDDAVTGVITLVHHTPGHFIASHLELLHSVAAQGAVAVENAALYRAVEQERSTLNAVLRSAADPILLIDAQDRVILANPAASLHMGTRVLAGRDLRELDPNGDLVRALAEPAANGTPAEVTLSDGDVFGVSVAPVYQSATEMMGRVVVLQDITAMKELERREHERLRSVVRRYVSPQVSEEVLAGGDFGDPVERDVVVIFADLRNYTALTEGLEPGVVVHGILNRYFTAMTDVLYRHGGAIDKFLGDGIIGLFGVPIAHDDDLERALDAALDLQRAFAELRLIWRQELSLEIGMGVGMSYGRAVVGNVGSTQRQDYTVIGDVVNTASRINGLAQPGQVLVSHQLVMHLPPETLQHWNLQEIGPVQLKGKQEPHQIYALLPREG